MTEVFRGPGLPTVVVTRLDHAMSVAMTLVVRAGSRDDPPGQEGMAHLLEHMVFQGTRRRPSALAVVSGVDRFGGELNAHTDRECTTFHAHVPAQRAPEALQVLVELVSEPLLRREDLDKERGVVAEEISVYEDAPDDYVHDLLREAAWKGHPLAHSELGSLESIQGVRAKDLRGFLHTNYTKDRMVLSVAGAVDPTGLMEEVASRKWPGIAQAARADHRVPPRVDRGRVVTDYQETEETHVALGFPIGGIRDPDLPTLLLLEDLLGGSMTSRLFQTLRERWGLVYDVETELDLLSDTGLLTISTGVQPEQAARAMRLLAFELKALAEGRVTDRELEHAKGHYLGSMLLQLEHPVNLSEWQARYLSLAGQTANLDIRAARVRAVTREDLARVAEAVLSPDRVSMAIIGPHRDFGNLQRAFHNVFV